MVDIPNKSLYLVPGKGNSLNDIGAFVLSLGYDVCGRELLPPFSNLHFPKQLELIQKDLESMFWHSDAKLIGHSFGGYLLLQALSDLEPFPGKILLFSPVLGASFDNQRLFMSCPPRAHKLFALAKKNQFPIPQSLELHTGEDDNGCDSDLAKEIGKMISTATVYVLPNQGHQLADSYVKKVISKFMHQR